MKDIGRCPRCDKFLIAEEYESHTCDIPFRGVEEIKIDWITDGTVDKNGDMITLAKGLDGIIYRLVQCEHRVPHRRWVISDECLRGKRPDGDLTEPASMASETSCGL